MTDVTATDLSRAGRDDVSGGVAPHAPEFRAMTSVRCSPRRRARSAPTRWCSTSSTTSRSGWCPCPVLMPRRVKVAVRPGDDGGARVRDQRQSSTSRLTTANPAAGFGCRCWTARSGSARWRSRSWAPSGRCPSRLLTVCERYAHLGATLIATKSMYSDFFELARRRQPMTMASELLWELVPPLVLAADDFVLAALLEPCYDMGGDAFDYALNDGVLHLAVFDGDGPRARRRRRDQPFALSAYRHSRRKRLGPAASLRRRRRGRSLDEYPSMRFVTALIAELELSSGAGCGG